MQRFEKFIENFEKFNEKHELTTRATKLVEVLDEQIQFLKVTMDTEIDLEVDCTIARLVITTTELAGSYISSLAVELAKDFNISTKSNMDKSRMDWISTIKDGLGMNGDYDNIHHFIPKAAMESLQDGKKFYIEDKFGNILGVGLNDLLDYIDFKRVNEIAEALEKHI